MYRIVISPQAVQRETIRISDPDVLHHLRRVLRLKVGDQVECLDGTGHRYRGAIVRGTARELVVAITERAEEVVPSLTVTLAQALIKPERFDWVIQKATELGVAQVVPLLTARTVVRLGSDHVERKMLRWQRIAREAAAQCGRATLPTIELPQRFDRFAPMLGGTAGVLMPTLSVAGCSLREALHALPEASSVVAVIGPEGDFTPEEVLLAQRHGARAVSLGRLTLRAETAAIVVVAIIQHELGLLETQSSSECGVGNAE